ncbi:MAG: hypothetical protein K6G50_06620 [bacterium]|nr:hypothetical protein [bacterium]
MKQFLASLIIGCSLIPAVAHAEMPSSFSGMAPFSKESVAVVNDAKEKNDNFRVAIYYPAENSMEKVKIDWGKQKRASDLEAICPVPGCRGEFFLAESGYWKGDYGRIFRLKVSMDNERGWIGDITSSFTPFNKPESGTTADETQIEGMEAVSDGNGGFYLLLGLRGNEDNGSKLVVSHLSGNNYEKIGTYDFSLHKHLPGCRSCADLQLLPMGNNTFRLYSLGARDAGDFGPFSSVVCEIGSVNVADGQLIFTQTEPMKLFQMDGLKAEALTITPRIINNSTFCIGTDDEEYGGIFRPLPNRFEKQ